MTKQEFYKILDTQLSSIVNEIISYNEKKTTISVLTL